MSIVKIHLYRSPTEKQQKYLLTYLPEIHSTIGHFLDFAIKALDIQNCTTVDLLVQNDGYILPHCLDGIVIKQMQLLTIKVRSFKKIPSFWTAQKIDQELQDKENLLSHHISNGIDAQQNQSEESTPKFSEDGLNRHQLLKKNSKQAKHHKKISKQSKSQPSKKNKIVEEVEEQSQSEEEQVQKPKKSPKLKMNKKIESFAKKSSSSQSSEEEQPSSQSSEEESSEEELPRVSRSKKARLQEKVQNKKVDQKAKVTFQTQRKSRSNSSSPKEREEPKKLKHSETKWHEQKQKEQVQLQKQKLQKVITKPLNVVISKPQAKMITYEQRKKIIEADDIESSDSSSEEQEQRKKVIVESKNVKVAQPKMLPPSLRNKSQQSPKSFVTHQPISGVSSFKKQQELKWIPISKEILEKYKKSLPANVSQQTPFSKPNNLIRFKEIELDEERFVPKTSEWIEATVENVESDGKLKLVKVTQVGKQYRDRYETYEHNMVEFQVNKDILTKEQKEVVSEGQQMQNKSQKIQQNASNDQNTAQIPSEQTNPNDRNSIEKFICGQVNYYFSDKNYQFDLFMQMHANKHPEKYIPIRFLLNFPKIKKVLRDQNKLLQYLIEDDKRTERNFQIDEERRLVRKKLNIIVEDKENANVPESKDSQVPLLMQN